MKTWQKALIPTLITLTIGGIYLFSVWKQRQDPGVIGRTEATSTSTVDKDDLTDVRQFFPHSFEDTLRLAGTTVWMKDGYAIPYFPYKGGRVEFGRRLGVIPSAQALNVKKVIKATVPDSVDDGMGHGDRQAIAVFTLPEGKDLYAMPIGILLVGEEQYYPDILFYYDDPHTIYSYWPKDVWAAIDAHQVKAGMSELQTQMAIGHMMHSHGGEEGNRTVTYDQGGKTWTVTFVKNRATEIKQG